MYDASYFMMILDIATSAWLIDFCYQVIKQVCKYFKKIYDRYQDVTEKYNKVSQGHAG